MNQNKKNIETQQSIESNVQKKKVVRQYTKTTFYKNGVEIDKKEEFIEIPNS